MNIEQAFFEVCRELQGECLADVARSVGVTSATLRNWRDGRVRLPRLGTFMKIATHYGYSVTVAKTPVPVGHRTYAPTMVMRATL